MLSCISIWVTCTYDGKIIENDIIIENASLKSVSVSRQLLLYLVFLFVGGFKGYGLAMMVEVFCGILADAAFGPNIRKWKGDERVANLVSRLQW